MAEGDLKELQELVAFLKASHVAEFDMERPELKVRLKFAGPEPAAAAAATGFDLSHLARLMGPSAPVAVPVPSAVTETGGASVGMPEGGAPAPATEADSDAGLLMVKSPLVGTFYDAPSPGAEPFVKVGDTVAVGRVLCIVEAMKIMNEIESDAAGEVVKVYVRPGQPVEYGQKLFGVK